MSWIIYLFLGRGIKLGYIFKFWRLLRRKPSRWRSLQNSDAIIITSISIIVELVIVHAIVLTLFVQFNHLCVVLGFITLVITFSTIIG